MTITDGSRVRPGFLWPGLLALLFFASHATALRAQSIEFKLIDGKTGHPVTSTTWLSPHTLYVGLGRESDLSLVLTTDKQGVVPLRFTRDDSEINVPECKGKGAAWDKLLKNVNKNDVKEFNKKYENCTNFFGEKPCREIHRLDLNRPCHG